MKATAVRPGYRVKLKDSWPVVTQVDPNLDGHVEIVTETGTLMPRVTDEVEALAPWPHPETGEPLILPRDFTQATAEIGEQLGKLYRLRDRIQEEYARRFPAPAMPERRRDRTETQERVHICPRCGLGSVREAA